MQLKRCLVAVLCCGMVQAGVPSGFALTHQGDGVTVYRKNFPGGYPDFVTVIDLSMGAGVVMLQGTTVLSGSGTGYYGGDNPSFQRRSQGTIWQAFAGQGDAFSMINGQYFDMSHPSRAPLAFPVKEDGTWVSEGYGGDEYPDGDLILEVFGHGARIRQLTPSTLFGSTAPTLIAGLTTYQCLKGCGYTGRTLLGVGGARATDGTYPLLYIFSSKYAREDDAASTLTQFGAVSGIQLDGGGSAMLTVQGSALVSTSRTVPQAVGVYEAP